MIESEKISFIENLAPSLSSGAYELSINHFVEGSTLLPVHSIAGAREFFQISTERFNINPADIESVYPPANGKGLYNETLPHIIFKRAGFPWERSPLSENAENNPETKSGTGKFTWLALLTFNENDPAPGIKSIRVGEINSGISGSGLWFPSEFELSTIESESTTVNVIDVPTRLFDEIKPQLKDLEYTAHARRVPMNHKPGFEAKNDKGQGEFGVLVGNRLPRAGQETVVHLVSLEGYQPVLESDTPGGFHSIRLISLKNWRFSCEEFQGSLKDQIASLNNHMDISPHNPLAFHFPVPVDIYEKSRIRDLLKQGFVPMEHKFRQGRKSISWYRSPLCPFKFEQIQIVDRELLNTSDAWLIYDPNEGFYDVSLAAAWQLGQLLGLQNLSYAKALYFWKQHSSVEARKAKEKELIEQKLPYLKTQKDGSIILQDLSELESLNSPTRVNLGSSIDKQTQRLDIGSVEINEFKGNSELEWYQIIQKFLLQLKALKNIPFNYLVPDIRMLPPDSIKLFYIDPNWLEALLDGAFSIGDITDHDLIRKKQLQENGISTKTESHPGYSGFLLRSRLFDIWPGLEVRIFDETNDKENPLPFVRHEKISDDLLICIVEGEIQHIELREPPEGLHFGVSEPKLNKGMLSFDKQVRSPENSTQSDTGQHKDPLLKISYQLQNSKGVIPMADLANNIRSAHLTAFGEKFTAADFGFVMVQPVSAVEIEIVNTSKSSQDA